MVERRHLSPIVAVDLVILSVRGERLEVLLLKRQEAPDAGKWALPGALLDPDRDDSLEATAQRALEEKLGVGAIAVRQVHTFSGGKRDPRDWSISTTYCALVPEREAERLLPTPLTSGNQWHPVQDPPSRMAFDHRAMIDKSVEQLVTHINMGGYPLGLVPRLFTLSELQAACAAVLGRPLDKSVFRRQVKILMSAGTLPFVEAEGEFKTGTHRPAQLYCERC